MIGEFRSFLLKTNALALAIGVIIGTAMGSVVNSLVNDIIMPPIGYALGGLDFSQLKWVIKATDDPKTEVAIRYGTFINVLIAFIVIACVVFVISKLLIRPEPKTVVKTCPFCKEANDPAATRCRACTSTLE